MGLRLREIPYLDHLLNAEESQVDGAYKATIKNITRGQMVTLVINSPLVMHLQFIDLISGRVNFGESPLKNFYVLGLLANQEALVSKFVKEAQSDLDVFSLEVEYPNLVTALKDSTPTLDILELVESVLLGRTCSRQLVEDAYTLGHVSDETTNWIVSNLRDRPSELLILLKFATLELESYKTAREVLMDLFESHVELAHKLSISIFLAVGNRDLLDAEIIESVIKSPNWPTFLLKMTAKNLIDLSKMKSEKALMALASPIGAQNQQVLTNITGLLEGSVYTPKLSWVHDTFFTSNLADEFGRSIIEKLDPLKAANVYISVHITNSEIRNALLRVLIKTPDAAIKVLTNAVSKMSSEEIDFLYKGLTRSAQGSFELYKVEGLEEKYRLPALLKICSSADYADRFLRINFDSLSDDEIVKIAERMNRKTLIEETTFRQLRWPKAALPYFSEAFGKHFSVDQLRAIDEVSALRVIQRQMAQGVQTFLQDLSFWSEGFTEQVMRLSVDQFPRFQAQLIQSLLKSDQIDASPIAERLGKKGLFSLICSDSPSNREAKALAISEIKSRRDIQAIVFLLQSFSGRITLEERTSLLEAMAEHLAHGSYFGSRAEIAALYSLPLTTEDKTLILHTLLVADHVSIDSEALSYMLESPNSLLVAMLSVIVNHKHSAIRKEFLLKCVSICEQRGWYDKTITSLFLGQLSYSDLIRGRAPVALRHEKIKSFEISDWDKSLSIPEDDSRALVEAVSRSKAGRNKIYQSVLNRTVILDLESWNLLSHELIADFHSDKTLATSLMDYLPGRIIAKLLRSAQIQENTGLKRPLLRAVKNITLAFKLLPRSIANEVLGEMTLDIDTRSDGHWITADGVILGKWENSRVLSPYPLSEDIKTSISSIAANKAFSIHSKAILYADGRFEFQKTGRPLNSVVIADGRLNEILRLNTSVRPKSIPVHVRQFNGDMFAYLDEDELSTPNYLLPLNSIRNYGDQLESEIDATLKLPMEIEVRLLKNHRSAGVEDVVISTVSRAKTEAALGLAIGRPASAFNWILKDGKKHISVASPTIRTNLDLSCLWRLAETLAVKDQAIECLVKLKLRKPTSIFDYNDERFKAVIKLAFAGVSIGDFTMNNGKVTVQVEFKVNVGNLRSAAGLASAALQLALVEVALDPIGNKILNLVILEAAARESSLAGTVTHAALDALARKAKGTALALGLAI